MQRCTTGQGSVWNQLASNKGKLSQDNFQERDKLFQWPVLSFNKSGPDQLSLPSLLSLGNVMLWHEKLFWTCLVANHQDQVPHNKVLYFGMSLGCFARELLERWHHQFKDLRLQVYHWDEMYAL